MKKEKILKIMLVIIMGTVLFAMTTNVLALTDDDFYLDITNTVDNTSTNTNTNTNTNVTNTNTNVNMNLNTNNNYNTSLPKAGIEENTMLGVAITVLGITAVYAYKKVKDYKNI